MATPITKNRPVATPSATKKGLSDNQRWIYGFLMLGFAAFLFISVVAYYFYWADDQDIVVNNLWGDPRAVINSGGKAGAWLAEMIVGRWFGVLGIVIPIVLSILALRIMRFRPLVLRRSVRISVIMMIIGSVTLGFVFADKWELFGTGLGGAHGIYVAQWLESVLGFAGTALLLLVSAVLLGVYINRSTISVVNKVGKGLVEGGIKVGGAVTQQAATMIRNSTKSADGNSDEDELSDNIPVPVEAAKPIDPAYMEAVKNSDFEVIDTTAKQEPEIKPAYETDGVFHIIDTRRKDAESLVESVADVVADGITVIDLDGNPIYGNDEPLLQGGSDYPERESIFEVVDKGSGLMGAGGVIVSDGSLADMEVLVSAQKDIMLKDSDIENALYDPTLELSRYQRPPIEILEDHSVEVRVTEEEIYENKNRIIETLDNFGISINKIKATIGPTVTLYEIVPAPGIRISKIKNLEDDIALSLSALGIRIIAPMPGQGTIGIEVPNKDKEVVSMYSVIKSLKFQDSSYELPIVLGKTIQNETFVIDLAKMPHLLVAGATGQGKSVGLNAIITSLLYKKHPAELKFVLVDPKKVELTLYSKLERHFLAKIPGEDDAIITDTQKVVYTLNSLCIEMDSRYNMLRNAEVRQIKEYNDKFIKRKLNPNKGHRFLPYIVVVIDEFADMIMTAGREIETPIARLAQLARAVGIHLVIATQRPTTNIITGVIKANFPARIAFRVSSMIDSRTIIDTPGANQLIGRGDMLISTGSDLTRVQCAFIDTPEVEKITEFISKQAGYGAAYELPEYSPEGSNSETKNVDMGKIDDMFEDVANFVVQHQQGSTSSIQRRFSIGYNRAGRIMDQMEVAGIVGRAEGSKPREVLVTDINSLAHILKNM